MPLEKYYPGDEAFARLAKAYEAEWGKCNFKEELIEAVDGDVGIAVVAFGQLGENALNWLRAKVPALDGLTPKACMKSEKGTLE